MYEVSSLVCDVIGIICRWRKKDETRADFSFQLQNYGSLMCVCVCVSVIPLSGPEALVSILDYHPSPADLITKPQRSHKQHDYNTELG